MSPSAPTVALFCSAEAARTVFAEPVLARIRRHASTLIGPLSSARDVEANREALQAVEYAFGSWGAPRLDEALLGLLPALKAVFYAAGTVQGLVSDTFWARGIRLSAAGPINAIPVAEYTASVALLSLRRFWQHAHFLREQRRFPADKDEATPGAYRSVVGLVSYGAIARLVRRKLRECDLRVLVYDPFLDESTARSESVERVSLDEVFATADVVSLHTPLKPETVGLVTTRHFELMKPGATFINTARGQVVDEPALIEALRRRSDLQAVLDVTVHEPSQPDSPLYTLPNVVLTPHIAGSVGPERQRLGLGMVDEFERFLTGEPLGFELNKQTIKRLA